jgi:hypothetical protein
MHDFASHAALGMVSQEFTDGVEKYWLRKSRILVLVDGRLRVLPYPAPVIGQEFVISTAFGISVAIATLKNFAQGFSSFQVTVATRDGDGSPKAGHDINP